MEKHVKYITHMHNTWWKTWGYSLDWLAGGLPLAKVLPMQAVHDTWHMTAEKSSQRCLWYVNDIGTVFIFWDLFQHVIFLKIRIRFLLLFLVERYRPSPKPISDQEFATIWVEDNISLEFEILGWIRASHFFIQTFTCKKDLAQVKLSVCPNASRYLRILYFPGLASGWPCMPSSWTFTEISLQSRWIARVYQVIARDRWGDESNQRSWNFSRRM